MLLKRFGFCLKLLAYSTAKCTEIKGAATVNNQAGLYCVLGVEVFLAAGLTKTAIAT